MLLIALFSICISESSDDISTKYELINPQEKSSKQQIKIPVERGRNYTNLFYENQLESLENKFDKKVKNKFNMNQFKELRDNLSNNYGDEVELIFDRIWTFVGVYVYDRTSKFSKYNDLMFIRWIFGRSYIYHFEVKPHPPMAYTEYLDYITKTDLKLPFNGEWEVLHGGRFIQHNYHAKSSDQRFAYDFYITKDGSSHSGDGKTNEQYYCYGQGIFAPADGTVIELINTIIDNRPGKDNLEQPRGNYIIIDHGNGEFSFIAHLKKESINVKIGDRVKAGQFIGNCGNSGATVIPHLHYHLQNSPIFKNGQGLPAQFQFYISDGQKIDRGEPICGQKIKNK